jgi:hypothetical protein
MNVVVNLSETWRSAMKWLRGGRLRVADQEGNDRLILAREIKLLQGTDGNAAARALAFLWDDYLAAVSDDPFGTRSDEERTAAHLRHLGEQFVGPAKRPYAMAALAMAAYLEQLRRAPADKDFCAMVAALIDRGRTLRLADATASPPPAPNLGPEMELFNLRGPIL